MTMGQNATLEIIAPTADEAIEKGLDQLGLPRDAVSVDILDEGKAGFLGLGNRQVRVRLTIKDHPDDGSAEVKKEIPTATPEQPHEDDYVDELEEAKNRAETIVQTLISYMKVNAKVNARILEPEDEHDRAMILVEITGNDLSILIGRRAETLN